MKYRLTVKNPKPLGMVDSILFAEWSKKMKAALEDDGPVVLKSWPEYRDQRKKVEKIQ